MDCIVVGYHELDTERDELAASFEHIDLAEVPPALRNVLRSQLLMGERFESYLDTLSRLCATSGDAGFNHYTVAELPSLGTLYLVNYLRKHGHDTEYVNSFTYERERLAKLLSQDPVAIAITTTFYMMPAPVLEIVQFIREHNDTVRIIVGGPLIDNYCRSEDQARLNKVLDRIDGDYYIWDSQGEATLEALVDRLKTGRDVVDLSNVFRRVAGTWTMALRAPENNDLNATSVDWRQFTPAELGTSLSTRTARSCAFKCAFCDYPQRAGALALADVATVERELEALANLGVKRVAFIDDTFNIPASRFQELCRMMVRRSFGIEWFSYFRCSNARDPDLYDLMKDAGCAGVLLGIESGDDGVLTSMNKRARVKDYQFGLEQLKRRDIFTHASLIVGFPGETFESVAHTIDFINRMGPNTFTVNHWYYLHSTPVHKRSSSLSLVGEGHQWSHATMTSRQAIDAAVQMFEQITGAAWMPVSGLDFWGVPYLLGKGMRPDQVVEFLVRAKPLSLAKRMNAGTRRFVPDTVAEAELLQFCRGLQLTSARYTSA